MCTDMRIDVCMDMCTDMCPVMRMDMCTDMRLDMRIGMRIDTTFSPPPAAKAVASHAPHMAVCRSVWWGGTWLLS